MSSWADHSGPSLWPPVEEESLEGVAEWGAPACLRAAHSDTVHTEAWPVHYGLKTLTEFEAKGTYFLIISLLVSSSTVVKETKIFEKLFSFPVGRGYLCSAYVVCGNGPVVL